MNRFLEFLNPRRPVMSFPQAACQLAVGLAAGFLLVHALGWREDVSFISGTVGPHGTLLTGLFGILYLMFYFAFVLVVPILLLALVIYGSVRFVLNREKK